MIVCHRWQFVYLGPPKTASTTLHHWLSQPALASQRWKTKEKDDQHSILIPPEAKGYFVFASIRNPVDRAVSLWAHSQYFWLYPQNCRFRNPDARPMSFRQFVFDFQPHASWFYRASISEILAPVRLDAVVRFEHLEQDLLRLPPIAEAASSSGGLEPLPHSNPAPHPDRDKVCTPDLAEAIADRWSADFELYGTARSEEHA